MAAAAATATAAAAATQIPTLHPRLLNFFAKFPPQRFSAFATGQSIPTQKQRRDTSLKPLSAHNVPKAATLPTARSGSTLSSTTPAQASESPLETDATLTATSETADATANANANAPADVATATDPTPDAPFNPFLPLKVHTTGKWRGPMYGLRVQADLFKLAREYGVEELLPPSTKSTEYKQRRALERGLAVRGTGEGQRVKGHKWERQMANTVEKRRKAMEEMPEMIRLWQERGHGRGWKKFPK